jgi:hypothetical protein
MGRLVRALEGAERKHAKEIGLPRPRENAAAQKGEEPVETLDHHLRAIDRLGWRITGIVPK